MTQNIGYIKRINKLKQKKYREEFGEFYVEGYKNALDTCLAAPDLVRAVILSRHASEKCMDAFERFSPIVIDDIQFDKIKDTENSQGVISVHSVKATDCDLGERIVLLDRVRDPGNVGTILRTCCACGYGAVLNNCADVYSPKVARSGMSAVIKCNFALDLDIAVLKSRGYQIIAADMSGENAFTAKPIRGKYCIVIGNEADGVSADIMRVSDRVMRIPQNNIESLNAAVAAGVLMYTLMYVNNN